RRGMPPPEPQRRQPARSQQLLLRGSEGGGAARAAPAGEADGAAEQAVPVMRVQLAPEIPPYFLPEDFAEFRARSSAHSSMEAAVLMSLLPHERRPGVPAAPAPAAAAFA
ncbi:unnamed protein product, partial [Prorocentrum cordatum]